MTSDSRYCFPETNRFLIGHPRKESGNDVSSGESRSDLAGKMSFTSQEPSRSKSPSSPPFRVNSRSIHSNSINSSAAYLPISGLNPRGKHISAAQLYTSLQKFHVGTSSTPEHVPHPASNLLDSQESAQEIPVFHLNELEQKDPISLVEHLKSVGQKYGAVKIKMSDAYISNRTLKVDPDQFTFKASRILNNPDMNELDYRLKFYLELIKVHSNGKLNDSSKANSSNSSPTPGLGPEIKNTEPSTPMKTAFNIAPKEDSAEPHLILRTDGVVSIESDTSNNIATTSSAVLDTNDLVANNPKLLHKQKLPIFLSKLPIMDKRTLDLFDLFRFVVRRGGYLEVINKKLWAQVGRELGYKGKITSSLSSSLKMSYAKILYPLEVHMGEKASELTGDKQSMVLDVSNPEGTNFSDQSVHYALQEKSNPRTSDVSASNEEDVPRSIKRRRLTTNAPLILGSRSELRRSVRIKASKGFLLNQPRLIDLKTPLVVSSNNTTPSRSSGDATAKFDNLILSIGAPAQINNYLKWLAINSPVIEDATRLDTSSKLATTYSLRQYLEKDSKFQDYLIATFNNEIPELADKSEDVSGDISNSEEDLVIESKNLEKVFWKYIWQKSAEFSKLDYCSNLPTKITGIFNDNLGDDFAKYKTSLFSELNHNSGIYSGCERSTIESDHEKSELDEFPYLTFKAGVKTALDPFRVSNIPFLPNSLMGTCSATDIYSNSILDSSLNIGMTFTTENWRCEDHFLQLCDYHSFGKSKRWYFIAEQEFEKFEQLIREIVSKQNQETPRLNINHDQINWNSDIYSSFFAIDDEPGLIKNECLLNSLDNIVNPFPELRGEYDDELFSKLINNVKSSIVLNQEYLITPEMLKEKGIKYSTTLQNPGEMIFKFPKTYSSTISLGFNISEKVNFASRLWLDYAKEGEDWLTKQRRLPCFSTFKLLANFAQLLESNLSDIHFSSDIYSKISDIFVPLVDSEMALRNKIRGKVKMREVLIEERNLPESDAIADDDLSNAFPSKVVINSKKSGRVLLMSLITFQKHLDELNSNKSNELSWFKQLMSSQDYQFELHLFFSDEKLKSLQRILKGHSVDYEAWIGNYEELMNSEEEIALKNYKILLQEGQKIRSALSVNQESFDKFCSGKYTTVKNEVSAERIHYFCCQIENLKSFVEEATLVIEKCHSILSLKHQQRIRNGSENNEIPEADNLKNIQVLVELVNKIPRMNLYAPEFDQVIEFKNEILNFDRACRVLIQQKDTSISELNEMINLGISFGIKVPSLEFLIRIRDRMSWISTYETIIRGGDPFSGKKEIFALPDLKKFHDDGIICLATEDSKKLEDIEDYLREGQEYDDAIKSYLSVNTVLNDVAIPILDSKISSMEERSKMKGKNRLFVNLSTYNSLLDLKSQEKYISFFQNFTRAPPNLFDTRQLLAELKESRYSYRDEHIRALLDEAEKWLADLEAELEGVKVIEKQRTTPPSLKMACNPHVIKKIHLIMKKASMNFANPETDVYELSSAYMFTHNLQENVEGHSPTRYCICREYEEGTMIECDTCHEWFHVSCVNELSEIGGEEDSYYCPACLSIEEYRSSLKLSVPKSKLTTSVVSQFRETGTSLLLKPSTELDALRDLDQIIQETKKWYDQSTIGNKIEVEGFPYLMFLYRKFFGAPILIEDILFDLMKKLKDTQIPLIEPEGLNAIQIEDDKYDDKPALPSNIKLEDVSATEIASLKCSESIFSDEKHEKLVLNHDTKVTQAPDSSSAPAIFQITSTSNVNNDAENKSGNKETEAGEGSFLIDSEKMAHQSQATIEGNIYSPATSNSVDTISPSTEPSQTTLAKSTSEVSVSSHVRQDEDNEACLRMA